jgi:hypothetical protein
LDNIRSRRRTGQLTTELLELLWVLEATVASYPEQAKLLESVVKGHCFSSAELPAVPEKMRKPPEEKSANRSLFERSIGRHQYCSCNGAYLSTLQAFGPRPEGWAASAWDRRNWT